MCAHLLALILLDLNCELKTENVEDLGYLFARSLLWSGAMFQIFGTVKSNLEHPSILFLNYEFVIGKSHLPCFLEPKMTREL